MHVLGASYLLLCNLLFASSSPRLLHRPAWIFLSLMPVCMPLAVMAHSLGYVSPSLAHTGSFPGGHDSGVEKRRVLRVRVSTRHIVLRLFSLSLHGSVETQASVSVCNGGCWKIFTLIRPRRIEQESFNQRRLPCPALRDKQRYLGRRIKDRTTCVLA